MLHAPPPHQSFIFLPHANTVHTHTPHALPALPIRQHTRNTPPQPQIPHHFFLFATQTQHAISDSLERQTQHATCMLMCGWFWLKSHTRVHRRPHHCHLNTTCSV
jgi:hypothetical protein